MVTDEQIRDTIDNCSFAHNFYDAVICQLLVEPCVSGVNEGRCPELQKLFSDERKKKAAERKDGVKKNEESTISL